MYSVYADNRLIYAPDRVEDGYIITNATCEKEINKSGSFKFTISTINPAYNALHILKTVIVIKDDTVSANNGEIWRGRVLSTERGFDNQKMVTCEGTYSYFVDSVVRPYEYECTMKEHFKKLINKHNEQVEQFKKFKIGTIDVEDLYGSKKWSNTSYDKTKDAIDDIVSDYGGYIVVGYDPSDKINTISYVKDPTIYSTQLVEFGNNLLDITVSVNPDAVFTVLIPIGYDSDDNKITIESVNAGKDYIESTDGVSRFGKIFESHTFDQNVSSPSELLKLGKKYLADNIKESTTITVNAIDLHIINPSVSMIDIYQLIKVKSEPHNVDEYEMCTAVSINIQNPSANEYTIGTPPTSITDIVAKNAITIKTSSGGGGTSYPDGDSTSY